MTVLAKKGDKERCGVVIALNSTRVGLECASVCEASRSRGVVLLCRLNERKRSINTNVRTEREYRRFFYVHYIFTTSVTSNAVMILFILYSKILL